MQIKLLNFSFFLWFTCAIISRADFAVQETKSGAVVTFKGELVTNYIVNESNKPFLWPLVGPGDIEMTRAYPMKDIKGERRDHPHHRSIWFGHQSIDGFDTWHEPKTYMDRRGSDDEKKRRLAKLGPTAHRKFLKLSGGKHAVIVAVNDYLASDGRKLLADKRTLTFQRYPTQLLLDFDIVFTAEHGDCRIGDMKDSGFSVRVPTSMDVDSKKDGRIINSEGLTDKNAWGKRAKWVSYTGQVEGKVRGIAILNHPESFRHPTPWHVRTYGLFTANPFGTRSIAKEKDGTFVLEKGKSFSLRHRVIFHEGNTDEADISKAWVDYVSGT